MGVASDPMPTPENGTPQTDQSAAKQERDARGTLRIQDFGDEVHLSFEQRLPWEVALEILRILKTPGPPDEGDRT